MNYEGNSGRLKCRIMHSRSSLTRSMHPESYTRRKVITVYCEVHQIIFYFILIRVKEA